MSGSVNTVNKPIQDSVAVNPPPTTNLVTSAEATGPNLFQPFPKETVLEIFYFLRKKDLKSCLLTNKTWSQWAKCALIQMFVEETGFGRKKWGKYLGIKVNAVPLSQHVIKIFSTSSRFFSGTSVGMAHRFVLIPHQTVEGKPLNVKSLEQHSHFIADKFKRIGCVAYFSTYIPTFTNEGLPDIPPKESSWILVPKTPPDFDEYLKKLDPSEYPRLNAFEAAASYLGSILETDLSCTDHAGQIHLKRKLDPTYGDSNGC
jgi:hypothetical protein